MPRSPRPASGGIVWRWGSLWRRTRGDADQRGLLADPPGGWPADWVERVNQPQTREEREAVALCIARGRPRKKGSKPRTAQ